MESTVREGGRSVLRAVDVLEYVAGRAAGRAPGVVDISRALHRDKSVVSRNLRVLTDAGLLNRDPVTLGYRIGARLFAIAASAHDSVLTETASTIVTILSDRLRERIDVTVRDDARVVTVATSAPDTPLQAIGRVGSTFTLLGTAAGRALLFDADEELVRTLFAQRLTHGDGPGAPRSPEQAWERLLAGRRLGWMAADEEIERSLSAVAVPVRDAGGRVVAALSAAGPTDRVRANADIVPAVMAAAVHLSTALGHVRVPVPEVAP